LGEALAPLRKSKVIVMGSGNLVHNLRRLDMAEQSEPEPWAIEFDDWVSQKVALRDYDSLIDYEMKAPALELAHPTREHYLPLLVAAGAGSALGSQAKSVIEGFEYGNLSRRSLEFS
jgi:4,5-DOPA dioxygenase extradiol